MESEEGRRLMGEKKFEAAIAVFSKELYQSKSETARVETLCNRAICHRHLQEHANSLSDLNDAATLAPDSADILAERAVTYFHLEMKKQALADLDAAVRLDAQNPYRYSSRAYIRASAGDTQGAVEDYLKAIALDPEDMVAHNNLSLLEEKLGRMTSAKKHAEKADNLAGVAKTRTPGHAEPKQEVSAERLMPNSARQKSPARVRSAMALLKEMRRVFATKEGFWEYLRYLRGR